MFSSQASLVHILSTHLRDERLSQPCPAPGSNPGTYGDATTIAPPASSFVITNEFCAYFVVRSYILSEEKNNILKIVSALNLKTFSLKVAQYVFNDINIIINSFNSFKK